MPIKNIPEFRSDCAWNVSFYALLMPASKVAKVAGTTGTFHCHFSMIHDFRQSSEALRLSQVSRMLLQLSGQISAHCSSEIRNTHSCLFRPDRDRDEKSGRKPSAIDDSDRGAIAPIAPRTSAKNAKRSTTAIAERSLPSRREIRSKTLRDFDSDRV